MMLNQYMKELEQEPFSADEFVERIAWRTISETRNEGSDDFNPGLVHESFVQAIKDLEILRERQQKKSERLEAEVRDEEQIYLKQVQVLQERNKGAIGTFAELDEKINSVATKVIHLGEQLDSVNGPRARAVEAQRLMTHLSAFIESGRLNDELWSNKTRLNEAADIIQKLQLIAQELPSPKFENAKKKIDKKYDEIERCLIEEFSQARHSENIARMKELASILIQFKSYSQCIDAFIEKSQADLFTTNSDIFTGLVPMCERNYNLMTQVFSNPEQVMAKFVLNIYHLTLQTKITDQLSKHKNASDMYLRNLYELYLKTNQLSKDLSQFNMGTDETYLTKLTDRIFQKYLDNYPGVELRSLKDKCKLTLQKYYDSKNHQKKQIQTGGFQDLRRDLQAVIGTRANINIAQIEDYGGETFLSEELAINILQESKQSYQRCQILSKKSDVPLNAARIFELLVNLLMIEHVDYAIELGLQNVPIAETGKSAPPEIHFFTITRQVNAIVHLFEKQFIDSLVPLIIGTSKYEECLEKKRNILEQIETKLDAGLDRSLNAILGWVKIYLQTEQKKTDFKPETDDIDTIASPACLVVVQNVNNVISQIKNSLDGKNIATVLEELGTRLHRVIYDHLLQFQYNTAGAMCAICDVNEYRRCSRPLGPLVEQLFDSLHSLCNLLLVKPENLQQVCNGEQLKGLERSILLNFVQLRNDYKTQKLANSLRGLSS